MSTFIDALYLAMNLETLSPQVKKIMNQVFQSLRGKFELDESYEGRIILGTIMNTIKVHSTLMGLLKWGLIS